MIVRTRFAPSPTGRLHLGHVLAATVARDVARQHPDGKFLLRHEDIDRQRVREDFKRKIETDLKWLGLDWDEIPLHQSTRGEAYDMALESLREKGIIYPCFCTRREIQMELNRAASAPHAPDISIYPGTCRNLTESIRRKNLDAGIAQAWRLDSRMATLMAGPLTFTDLRWGTVHVDASTHGDVILSRKDIGPAYHLAVVVDDAFQKISHVTRGEDLLSATHVHRILQANLCFPEPVYLHHSLVVDAQGVRLAKHSHAEAIEELRDRGESPSQVLDRITDFTKLYSLMPNNHFGH